MAILGRGGAEKLLGKGQMIFDSPAGNNVMLQGAYISEEDIEKELVEIKNTFKQVNKFPFIIENSELIPVQADIIEDEQVNPELRPAVDEFDKNLLKVINYLSEQGKISGSEIMELLHVGNKKSKQYLMKLEGFNLIPPLNGGRGARGMNPIEEIKITELKEYFKDKKELFDESIFPL
jgi:DNA segregation ATPase FtsK/SpoIIIE-like protein